MKKRVLARIRPSLLVWARESAGLTVEQAATKAGVSAEALQSWEADDSADQMPSIPQARKLAEIYKRPLAVLYLPAPPTSFMPLKDFRRLPGGGTPSLPPEVVIEARLARERREAALSLAEEFEIDLPTFDVEASLHEDPEVVGDRVRRWLNVELPLGSNNRDAEGNGALRVWRQAAESRGVFVLQTARFSAEAVSGFAIFEKKLPIVVISRKDAAPRKRLFSLAHELAHLLLRASGVSDNSIDSDLAAAPEEQLVEIFCNAVAGALLVPADELLKHQVVREHSGLEWSDDELWVLSREFGASREAILRRLLRFERTTRHFYEETRERFDREFKAKRLRDRMNREEGIPRNMAQEAISDLGRKFVGLVLENYHLERLTLSDVAGHLGIKTRHIPAVEQLVRKSA